MGKTKKVLPFFTLLALVAIVPLAAMNITVITHDGEKLPFYVNPNDSIENLVIQIEEYLEEEGRHGEYLLDLWNVCDDEELVCKAQEARDYYADVSDSSIKDIRFIITTLGNQPLVKLKKYKSPLKSAGDRLENIHPLNVWRVIFTNNDTVSAMYNIKRRHKVWKSFMKGMAKSLQEASDRQNIKPEHIADFAEKVGVSASDIQPYIAQEDWAGFIKQLLILVGRDGDPDRYDQ